MSDDTEFDVTANFGLKKPWVGFDDDLWGDHLNANMDLLDTLLKSRATATTSDAPPLNPVPGQLWFDSSNPQLYVWFVDPTSAQWVIATAYAGGLTTDAPSDGHVYGRQNGAWTDVSTTVPYLPLVGGTVSGPTTFQAGLELTGGALTTLLGGHLRDPASVPTARWMVDFQQVTTAAGGLIRGTNFSVGGGGNVRIGFGALKPDPIGLIIDTDGHQAASATVATPGSGYVVGYITDVPGNIWHIDTIDVNGGVTGVTLNKAILTSTTLTPLSLVAPDWSPDATGCTLNVTYASGTTLSVQPSGGPTVFGGPITLPGNATLPLHAVPLQQIPSLVGGPYLPLATGGTVAGATTYSLNGVALTVTPGKLNILSALANTASAALLVQSNINTATTQSARNIDSIIGSVTGTYTGTGAAWGNQFATQSFNADVRTPSGGEYVNLASSVTFGGANTKGSVAATRNIMVMNANSANAPGSRMFHRAFSATAQTAFTDGGVPGNVAGNWFGGIFDVSLLSGATNWNSLVGLEIDVTAATGSSADYKIGLQIVLKTNDAVQGAAQNSFISTAAQQGWGGALGMTAGIAFGAANGVWAYDTASSSAFLLGALATPLGGNAYQIAYGMKLDNVTFTQAFLQSNGFKVDGSGRCSPLLTNAANDAAAASAGVPIGAMYRNGNAVQVRLV